MRRKVGPGVWEDLGPSTPTPIRRGEVVIPGSTMGAMTPYVTPGGLPKSTRVSPWRGGSAVPGVKPLPPKVGDR